MTSASTTTFILGSARRVSPPTVWAWFEPHEFVAAGYEAAGSIRNVDRLPCLPIPHR
jgi:hypothetical protein